MILYKGKNDLKYKKRKSANMFHDALVPFAERRKIIEWNIHKMTNDILVKKYVVDVILETNADIIVLTEYMTDSLIEKPLSDSSYVYVNKNTKKLMDLELWTICYTVKIWMLIRYMIGIIFLKILFIHVLKI